MIRNFNEGKKSDRHIGHPNVEYRQVKSFSVYPREGGLSGPGSLNVDGELVGEAPFRATCIPLAISVIADEA